MTATVIINKDTKRADYYRALATHLRRTGRKKAKAAKSEIESLRGELEKYKAAYWQAAEAAVEMQKELKRLKNA